MCAHADEEVKAVQIMSAAMQHTPHSYTLLHAQCDFLRSKGKLAWALKLAKEAVNCAPSEFVTWEKLTELYIDTKDYESVCCLSLSVVSCTSLGDALSRHCSRSIRVPCLRTMARMYIDRFRRHACISRLIVRLLIFYRRNKRPRTTRYVFSFL